jgi:pimeloyl-ACP methyl ester carboxylesterase
LPGGGYSRGYFDVQWQGTTDYSQAEHHASRGWVVACIDHLGVGDSTTGPAVFSLDTIARADALVVTRIHEGLQAGTISPELPGIDIASTIGLGQSMGGYFTIAAQAIGTPFDAVAILGFSAIHTAVPERPGVTELVDQLRWAFFLDDVDPAIVDADMAGFTSQGPQPPWRSATIPNDVADLLQPGIATEQAAAIQTPVFVGTGERDVVPDPWAEPTAYRSSLDISLVVVERMAHMHNFAGTRQRLWECLHAWGDGIATRGHPRGGAR